MYICKGVCGLDCSPLAGDLHTGFGCTPKRRSAGQDAVHGTACEKQMKRQTLGIKEGRQSL